MHCSLGGRDGSDLQASNCPTSGSGGNSCFAAFLGLHLTTQSSAYLEVSCLLQTYIVIKLEVHGTIIRVFGSGWLITISIKDVRALYPFSRNNVIISIICWTSSTIESVEWTGYLVRISGSGLVDWNIQWVQSRWSVLGRMNVDVDLCSGEHSIMYQYSLVNAKDHYLGLIQTETVRDRWDSLRSLWFYWSRSVQPYFQPNPVPPAPFIPNSNYHDPSSWPGAAWALTVSNSQDILVFGTIHFDALMYLNNLPPCQVLDCTASSRYANATWSWNFHHWAALVPRTTDKPVCLLHLANHRSST